MNLFLLPMLVEMKLLFLDEAELEEHAESVDLGLVSKEDLMHFVALTLDLLQKHSQSKEEMKV